MTDWTTIRVKRAAKEAAEERKPPEMTWSEFIAAESYDPVLSVVAELDATEHRRIADEVVEELRSQHH